jgi:protein phosphatase
VESIALISDIHGNVPALEAVIKDIKNRGIKRAFCLGDFVGKGPNPYRALEMTCEFCENGVMGNWDALVALVDPGVTVSDGLRTHIDWNRSHLGPDRIENLARLPFSLDFMMSGRKVRLMHASPKSLFHRVYHNDSTDKQLALFENSEYTNKEFVPDVVGYSDIHYAFKKEYGNRILFNVGSVGNPLDIPTPSYTIMEGNYNSSIEAEISIEMVRVPYDVEKEVNNARASSMPDIEPYIVELRTAKYRGRKGYS